MYYGGAHPMKEDYLDERKEKIIYIDTYTIIRLVHVIIKMPNLDQPEINTLEMIDKK